LSSKYNDDNEEDNDVGDGEDTGKDIMFLYNLFCIVLQAWVGPIGRVPGQTQD
jgi:hypothetical protein